MEVVISAQYDKMYKLEDQNQLVLESEETYGPRKKKALLNLETHWPGERELHHDIIEALEL